MEQSHNKAVQIRKGVYIAIIAIVMIIVLLTIINTIRSMDSMKKSHANQEHKAKTFASEVDTSWYKNKTREPNHSLENIVEKSSNIPVSRGSLNENVKVSNISVKNEAILQEMPDDKAVLDAMKAPITSNQLTGEQGGMGSMGSPSRNFNQGLASSRGEDATHDINMQTEKLAFLNRDNTAENDYIHSIVRDPISPYELKAGSIIPGTLYTGINSDLPGQITGQVQSNVYDSRSGKHLLIPQGSKIVGIYDSQVSYGQERVLIVWNRIIFPNGQSLNLEGMSGVDMAGYAGFKDQVNSHYGKMLSSVILMSVLSSGAQLSQPQQSNSPFAGPTVGQTLAQSLGTNIANVGTAIVTKTLNVQPTLIIRPGYQFNIQVKKDIAFIKPYE